MIRLLFVHLAKTGGMSIRRMLMAAPGGHDFDCLHHGDLLEFRDGRCVARRTLAVDGLPPYDVAFMMVRHPLTRLFSCYRYFLHGGLNQFHPGSSDIDLQRQRLLLERMPSFRSCCAHLPEVAASIPHMRPMADWLDALPEPPAREVMIGQTETFDREVRRLFARLDLPLPAGSLLHLNRSLGVSPETDIDEVVREQVHRFYVRDYSRFDYDPRVG